MIPVTLSCDPHSDFELCQLDRNGRIVPRDQQTHVISQVPIDCTNSDGSIEVGFYVRGQVPVAEVQTLTDASNRHVSVAATVARSAFTYLPKIRKWPLYGSTEIPISEPFQELSIATHPLSVEVEIPAELGEALRVETKMRREVKHAFQKAKDFLYESLGYSPFGREAEIRSAARFLEACRRQKASDYGDLMDDYRHRELMPDIEHWLRLKNPNHPHVRAADDARTLIYLTHLPKYWAEPPPRPDQYGLEWLTR